MSDKENTDRKLDEVFSEEQEENNEDEEEVEEKKRFAFLYIKLPKWVLGLLMTIPALLVIGIILLVDFYVGFPPTINPIAILAVIGLCLVGFVVISDMAYRNYFSYRMVRRESAKSKVYKEIIREKEAVKTAKSKYEKIKTEYEYDDESEEYETDEEELSDVEEESEEEEEEIAEKVDEYTYGIEEEDESKYYRLKSLVFRGGIFSILIINGLILLVAAFILQLAIGGGFNVPTES